MWVPQQQIYRAAVSLHSHTLARQPNDVRIIEQIEQEMLHIVQSFWATQVQQEHANFVSCAGRLLQLQIR